MIKGIGSSLIPFISFSLLCLLTPLTPLDLYPMLNIESFIKINIFIIILKKSNITNLIYENDGKGR